MSKKMYVFFTVLILSAMVLAACAPKPTAAPEAAFKACQVTDIGGINDKSFNATVWKGFEDAKAKYGIDVQYLESQEMADYEVNLQAFYDAGCDVIVAVGFMLGDAVAAAAQAHPEQAYAGVDIAWQEIPNLRGSFYNIHEATFLAGYLAAGMTKTGIVGTYGGVNIPPVTAFMDGFQLGIEAYNAAHGTDVKLLGWDYNTGDGLFTGNFESTDDGRRMGETLLDEGADIIMPVAGPVGAGTLAVLEERGTGLLIGVDADWSAPFAFPDKADYILASAIKGMDLFVMDTIKMVMDGTFKGEQFIGTLENGRVGLVYGSAWADKIPDDLKAEIEDMRQKIISGEVKAFVEK